MVEDTKISGFSESYHEYLETIYRLQLKQDQEFVKNIDIARELKIKPPSVTEMIEKLEIGGLLEWKKRRGVKLSPKGEKIARQIIKNHVFLELFFWKILGIKEQKTRHALSCEIEHHVNFELIKALGKLLGVDKSFDLKGAFDVTEELLERINIPKYFTIPQIQTQITATCESLLESHPTNADLIKELEARLLERFEQQ